jgi:hypothetical protein
MSKTAAYPNMQYNEGPLHLSIYLFILSSGNNTFNGSDYRHIASNNKLLINNELKIMWKESVLVS